GGGAWGRDGRIVFSSLPAGGLSLVSDQGGAVTTLTAPDPRRGELRHVLPSWLPGGGILFTVTISPVPDTPGQLAVIPRDATTWKTLRGGVTRAPAPGARNSRSRRRGHWRGSRRPRHHACRGPIVLTRTPAPSRGLPPSPSRRTRSGPPVSSPTPTDPTSGSWTSARARRRA